MNLNFNDRTGKFDGFTPRSVQPDTKGIEAALGCFGALMLLLLIVALSAIVNGLALVQLWAWFVTPTFIGMPALTLPAAIGITLVVSHFKGYHKQTNDEKEEAKRNPGKVIISSILRIITTPL